MKKIIITLFGTAGIIVFIIWFTAVFFVYRSPSINDSYSGYVYYNRKPLKRVKIIEFNSENYTYTDEKEYFF